MARQKCTTKIVAFEHMEVKNVEVRKRSLTGTALKALKCGLAANALSARRFKYLLFVQFLSFRRELVRAAQPRACSFKCPRHKLNFKQF